MTTLQAIRALNAALMFGVNGLVVARHFGQVIEQAQNEDRDITDEEWQEAVASADAADAALAEAIREAAA